MRNPRATSGELPCQVMATDAENTSVGCVAQEEYGISGAYRCSHAV
jgi:hypothetical protein